MYSVKGGEKPVKNGFLGHAWGKKILFWGIMGHGWDTLLHMNFADFHMIC